MVSLSSIELTAALVMDPFTDRLLVSDRASGGILSCNVTLAPAQCSILVDPNQLTGIPAEGDIFLLLILSLPSPRPLSLSSAFSCLKVIHVYVQFSFSFLSLLFLFLLFPPVLPAVRIAVDETRIYWTSNTTEGVHYILKLATPPFNVTTLHSNGTGRILLSTSPGLQQLPGNGSKL